MPRRDLLRIATVNLFDSVVVFLFIIAGQCCIALKISVWPRSFPQGTKTEIVFPLSQLRKLEIIALQ